MSKRIKKIQGLLTEIIAELKMMKPKNKVILLIYKTILKDLVVLRKEISKLK